MKRIIIGIGALLSLLLTALGLYTSIHSATLSLPIPILACLLATALPILNGLSLVPYSRPSDSKSQSKFLPNTAFIIILSLLDTILITLASTYLTPQILQCGLEKTWRSSFAAKNVKLIRGVQDSLECCGLRSTRDQAWPFPDREHGADACVVAFGRGRSCEGVWMGEERRALGLMIGVGVVCLVSKAILLLVLRYQQGGEAMGWLQQGRNRRSAPRQITGNEEANEERGERGRYLDRPRDEEEIGRGEVDVERRALIDRHGDE